MIKAEDIDNELYKNIVAGVLRVWIGSGRKYTAKETADMIGQSLPSINNYLSRHAGPDGPGLLRLLTIPEVRLALLSKIAALVDCAVIPTDIEENGNDFQMNAILTDAVGLFGHALADGRIDHTERPEIVEAVKSLRQHADEWLAAHDSVKVRAVK